MRHGRAEEQKLLPFGEKTGQQTSKGIMKKIALAWRIEETCLNAWPAVRHVLLGDWLLRFSRGLSRRANSANPLRAEVRDIGAGLAAFEALYRAHQLPTIVRIPSIIDACAERRLEQAGYAAEGETLTLYSDIETVASQKDAGCEVLMSPSAAWLATMAAMQGRTEAENATYAQIVGLIAIPSAFAMARAKGEIVALAYAAIHEDLLCLESVITDQRHRGRGHARRLLATLIGFGAQQGAKGVCLQVLVENEPGRALYHSLGLKEELYRYHYRREP
jgi:N-acetylglutamate synthase